MKEKKLELIEYRANCNFHFLDKGFAKGTTLYISNGVDTGHGNRHERRYSYTVYDRNLEFLFKVSDTGFYDFEDVVTKDEDIEV